MKAVLQSVGALESCQPLTCTRPFGELPVANRPIREVQAERLAAAGFKVCVAPPSADEFCWFVNENAWLSTALLEQMVEMSAPAKVMDCDGNLLAWCSNDGDLADDAQLIASDADSFLVVFAWDLLRVNEEVVGALSASAIAGEVSPRSEFTAQVVIGEGTKILPGVYIEGNAIIGKNCKIGPNCYIRGNTSIGDNCHVGQAVEVKNSILMNGASIGHLSYCGDSVIGEKVNFGAGTTTSNLRHDGTNHRSSHPQNDELIDTGRRKFGTVAGDNVHTGINTSIYPGRKMWPDTTTRPADVVQKDIRE
jgi:bifunctional UDP-N-acetylglucosamine pyrophosphorylase/glucosamine-1-phosphate N-acetyltransferase